MDTHTATKAGHPLTKHKHGGIDTDTDAFGTACVHTFDKRKKAKNENKQIAP